MSRPTVAAIVPAYNEEKTIASVVKILRASPYVDDVVVVSDASSDQTANVAREAGARVLERATNAGKAEAMIAGAAQTNADVLLFADADLTTFTTDHIERILLPVLSGSRAMNVGLHDWGPLIVPFMRYLPLIGGERAMRREVFEGVPREFLKGYMVEAALNYYCKTRKLAYGSVPLSGLQFRRKFEKVGWKRAIPQYVRMAFQVATAIVIVRVARIVKRF